MLSIKELNNSSTANNAINEQPMNCMHLGGGDNSDIVKELCKSPATPNNTSTPSTPHNTSQNNANVPGTPNNTPSKGTTKKAAGHLNASPVGKYESSFNHSVDDKPNQDPVHSAAPIKDPVPSVPPIKDPVPSGPFGVDSGETTSKEPVKVEYKVPILETTRYAPGVSTITPPAFLVPPPAPPTTPAAPDQTGSTAGNTSTTNTQPLQSTSGTASTTTTSSGDSTQPPLASTGQITSNSAGRIGGYNFSDASLDSDGDFPMRDEDDRDLNCDYAGTGGVATGPAANILDAFTRNLNNKFDDTCQRALQLGEIMHGQR